MPGLDMTGPSQLSLGPRTGIGQLIGGRGQMDNQPGLGAMTGGRQGLQLNTDALKVLEELTNSMEASEKKEEKEKKENGESEDVGETAVQGLPKNTPKKAAFELGFEVGYKMAGAAIQAPQFTTAITGQPTQPQMGQEQALATPEEKYKDQMNKIKQKTNLDAKKLKLKSNYESQNAKLNMQAGKLQNQGQTQNPQPSTQPTAPPS